MFSSDLTFALRQLAKRPGLAATIILIMAAGVGVKRGMYHNLGTEHSDFEPLAQLD